MSAELRAAALSFLRVLAATALTAFLALDKSVSEMGVADLVALLDAVVAAGALTLANALGPWEKRYGRGATTR